VALATHFPKNLTLAMEIRPKVTEYVRLRIEALRAEHPGQVCLY
jgi:tRNA (guanine-N7-)-methyltransferase